MCASIPVHFFFERFWLGVAKSQVALAPSNSLDALRVEVANNWPRQECLVDCLSLIQTGNSVGEVLLLLRLKCMICMEEMSVIEDGLAVSMAGFLNCVALLGFETCLCLTFSSCCSQIDSDIEIDRDKYRYSDTLVISTSIG